MQLKRRKHNESSSNKLSVGDPSNSNNYRCFQLLTYSVPIKDEVRLIIQTEEKDIFGVFHLGILIDSKEYTFHLSSEYAVRKVKTALRKQRPGRALNILKNFNHKEIYNEEKGGSSDANIKETPRN